MMQSPKWVARAAVIAVGMVVMACQEHLPTAPSDVTSGITIYEHADFVGASALVDRDLENLEDFNGPCEHTYYPAVGNPYTVRDWEDCISSIRVAPGWEATVYRDGDYKGQSLVTTTDVANLKFVAGSCDKDGLNDCISSIRVRRR